MDADQCILEGLDHLIADNEKKIFLFWYFARTFDNWISNEANIKRSFRKFISIIIGLKTVTYSFNENSNSYQWKTEWTKANNNCIGDFITMKSHSVTAIASTCQHVTYVNTVLLTPNWRKSSNQVDWLVVLRFVANSSNSYGSFVPILQRRTFSWQISTVLQPWRCEQTKMLDKIQLHRLFIQMKCSFFHWISPYNLNAIIQFFPLDSLQRCDRIFFS